MPSPKRSTPTGGNLPFRSRFGPTMPHHNDADIEIFDLTMEDSGSDPLTYFLTPNNNIESVDSLMMMEMDFDMDFDAGIESSKNPSQIVRNVSPSNLEGFSRPPGSPPLPHHTSLRPPTPPRSPATPDLEFDNYPSIFGTPDDELDDHFLRAAAARTPFGMPPLTLRDFASSPPKGSSSSFRGRSLSTTGSGYNKASKRRSAGAARLSPHAWREPSPDVWSIEERPEQEKIEEEEYDSEVASSMMSDSMITESGETASLVMRATARAVDIPVKAVAKSFDGSKKRKEGKKEKRVRFVLPGVMDMH
ncbi:hypothetical protein QBC43DRAFT_56549 [Cladorrhinum sp. PSN259]|nr:hypothetical protein QBC43DRAFT_56549 [Cladorrhinum sp. PSN259]